MSQFEYREGQLYAEEVALADIAKEFGAPTYVYSRAHLEQQYRSYADALKGMPQPVCFG